MKFLIVFAIVAVAVDALEVNRCSGVDNSKCTIDKVTVDQCNSMGVCQLSKEGNVDVSVDFTPNFETSQLTIEIEGRGIKWDPPLDSDACKFTDCPTKKGRSQTWKVNAQLGQFTNMPVGTFIFQWKLADSNDDKNVCCFETPVTLQ